MSSKSNNNTPVSLIADFDGDIRNIFNINIDEELPILPLRNMVLFPGVVVPIGIERDFSLKLIKQAREHDTYFGVICQKNGSVNLPRQKDLYSVGTVAKLVRILELPDNKVTVLLQGFCRFTLNELTVTEPMYMGRVEKLEETVYPESDRELKALTEAIKDTWIRMLSLDDGVQEQQFAVRNISNPTFLINFACVNLSIKVKEKMELLSIGDIKKRAYKLLSLLDREVQFASLKASIAERTRQDIDEQQKEYFLHQQIQNMQDELGEDGPDQDYRELAEEAKKKKWPEEIGKVFDRELKKLERINTQSPDYNVQLNYLQTLLQLPWGVMTHDNINIKTATDTLNRDHYGLEKVKERILEYLAIIKLRGNLKSPILCLYGPPGVGKTSLGKSIAKALKRKYVRVSLGGVHDEAEIRGHRRTYVGAMPGRIIKSLIKCGSNNPVFVLDEIDKVSQDNINGDPASALLEVLDPEQNFAFHDNFLDLDYDLSHVMFIATANTLSTIPTPLLDRMELIEMTGYITEEKVEIAKRHLIPKTLRELGLMPSNDHRQLKQADKSKSKEASAADSPRLNIKFTTATLEKIIEQYTRESGVRQLDKLISKILRKIAFRYVKDGQVETMTIKPEHIVGLLGQPPFIRDRYQGNDYAGVVTGLAWTSVGGEILFIETSLSKGKGSKLTLTGNLGDVMKESAVLALEYIKAHADKWGIDDRIFTNWNIHIHVPEGAVPKDGPSAGITIATSIASALTQRKVKAKTAMTGEITLRGKVLPVGGIKEKILAAKRAGITDIIISRDNEKDIKEINEIYLKGLTFHYVENVDEVLEIALLNEKVSRPIDFTIKEPLDKTDKDE